MVTDYKSRKNEVISSYEQLEKLLFYYRMMKKLLQSLLNYMDLIHWHGIT